MFCLTACSSLSVPQFRSFPARVKTLSVFCRAKSRLRLQDGAPGLLSLLFLIRPELEESDETRGQYYRAHRNDIDPLKYRDYLDSVGGSME